MLCAMSRFAPSLLTLLVLLSLCACGTDRTSAPADPNYLPPIVDETDSTGAVIRKPNPWKNHGCELITEADLAALFQVDAKRDVLNSRALPDQAFCLRTWNKADWKERESNNEKEGATFLNPQNRLIVQVFGYGTVATAQEQIAMLRRDRRNTYEEDVTGLGDDALWSTSTVTLLVRRGHLVLNIALEHTDTPHDNLEKAKALALLALPRMWQTQPPLTAK